MSDTDRTDARDLQTAIRNRMQADRAVQALADTADEIASDLRQLFGNRPEASRAVLLRAVVNVLLEQRGTDGTKGLADLAWAFSRELVEVASEAERSANAD